MRPLRTAPRLGPLGVGALLLLSLLAVFQAVPAHAYTGAVIQNKLASSTMTATTYTDLTVHAKGDVLLLIAKVISSNASAMSGYDLINGTHDTFGNGWSTLSVARAEGNFTGHNYWVSVEEWVTTTVNSGTDDIYFSYPQAPAFSGAYYTLWDISGVQQSAANVQSLDCPFSCAAPVSPIGTRGYSTVSANSISFSGVSPLNVGTPSNGLGYTQLGTFFEYAVNATSPTNYPWTFSTSPGGLWTEVGVTFSPGVFTCTITNMDAIDYVVAGANRFYNFACEVQSNAVSSTNDPISDVKVRFNDSSTGSCTITCFSVSMPNIVVMEYDNQTGTAKLDQGGTIATLGTPTVSQSYTASNGVRTMNITFSVSLNTNAVSALNRGIELYASLNSSASRGFEYVQKDYFNVLLAGNGGGQYSKLDIAGSCSVPSGADVFQTICDYGSNSHNWIAENATYYQLQQYQGQFAIETRDQYGNTAPAFFQPYSESGSGTNPSSNPGDWKIDMGLYYWDNTSTTCCWVKGIHVTLSMLTGRVGSSNLWTQFQALWYNGATLVANQSMIAFVPDDSGPSQVNIWLNLWYSQNNASTNEGGEVGAYYTGMHNVGNLIWSSWSPFLGNETQSQVFTPIKDHTGLLMPAAQVQLTKVYMNMSRPGAPNVHTNQANFEIDTANFQEQEFNTAAGGAMTGMATPVFATAIVPVLASNNIFSPLVNALKALAGWIAKAFMAVGTLVWNALGSQFPWLTGFFSSAAGFIVTGASFVGTVFVWVIDFLKFMYGGLKLAAYPITIIGDAWGYIQAAYTPFKGANLSAILIIAVLWIFGGAVVEKADKGDTRWFIEVSKGAWSVAYAVFNVSWMIAKFLIDTVEGLIP